MISMPRLKHSARRTVAALAIALVAAPGSSLAVPPDMVPPQDSPYQGFGRNPGLTQVAKLPDMTLRLKNVHCWQDKVVVMVRLQNLSDTPVTQGDILTEVTAGGVSAQHTSAASPSNPFYNGQEFSMTLNTGYGTHQVSGTVDPLNTLSEKVETNNKAPSLNNSFDSNPDPLFITCSDPEEEAKSEGKGETRPVKPADGSEPPVILQSPVRTKTKPSREPRTR